MIKRLVDPGLGCFERDRCLPRRPDAFLSVHGQPVPTVLVDVEELDVLREVDDVGG